MLLRLVWFSSVENSGLEPKFVSKHSEKVPWGLFSFLNAWLSQNIANPTYQDDIIGDSE